MRNASIRSGGRCDLGVIHSFFPAIGLWNWCIYIWWPARVFSEIFLSPRDPSLLSCSTNHLFLMLFLCGPWKVSPRRCHSVALRNAWNPFKEHVKQQLGGSQQRCQKLHGWWQHIDVVCINGASLTNIYIWQVNSEGDSVCVNVTDQLWTMILLLFLLKPSD